MIVYTTNVCNAIAAYQQQFGYRIVAGEVALYNSETDFVNRITDCLKSNDPKLGVASKATSEKAKPLTREEIKTRVQTRIRAFDRKYGLQK